MQLTEAERREAKASPAFRLIVAMPDPVETVCDALATLDNPKHLFTHVTFLARRENYVKSAGRLENYLVPRWSDTAERRLVENILNFEPDNICAFRMAVDLKACGAYRHNRTLPKFEFTDLVALAAANGKKAKQAWIAVHALGRVRSARGVIAVEATSADCPGLWPAAPIERYALAFNLIVRTVHGARLDSIRLVP
jgi:hypothetical protein